MTSPHKVVSVSFRINGDEIDRGPRTLVDSRVQSAKQSLISEHGEAIDLESFVVEWQQDLFDRGVDLRVSALLKHK